MKTIALDISVLNEKNKTGVGIYTYQLIKHLLEINRKDKFILFGISTLQTYEYLKNIEFKQYPNVELKIFKMPAKFFRRAFLLWQKLNWPKIENFLGPVDIFHSFNWNLPPIKSGKIVATIFDMTPLLFPQFHLQKTIQLDKTRLDRIKKYADLVITISQNSKKDFLKFAPGKRVEVIYPGVSEQFEGERGKGKGERYILSVGTLEPRKNIKILIDAYLQSNLKEKLLLVGNLGWKNKDLLALIKKNADKIIATGYIPDEDLSYLYSRAVCFVYPSLYEGFGIPILEAMVSGVPVITSKVSSMPEAGGDAVYYIDPTNTKDIKKALIKVVKNKNLRDKMINKGFKQVKKFSWINSAEKLKVLYQSL